MCSSSFLSHPSLLGSFKEVPAMCQASARNREHNTATNKANKLLLTFQWGREATSDSKVSATVTEACKNLNPLCHGENSVCAQQAPV